MGLPAALLDLTFRIGFGTGINNRALPSAHQGQVLALDGDEFLAHPASLTFAKQLCCSKLCACPICSLP
jgi:hypothetical protein